jgi:amino acid adenylation domain-containing protein
MNRILMLSHANSSSISSSATISRNLAGDNQIIFVGFHTLIIELEGLDERVFHSAFKNLVAKYSAVLSEKTAQFIYFDLREDEADLAHIMDKSQTIHPRFHCNIVLCQLENKKFNLIFSLNHSIYNHEVLTVLLTDLSNFYNQLLQNRTINNSHLPLLLQYTSHPEKNVVETKKLFWLEVSKSLIPSNLKRDYEQPEKLPSDLSTESFALDSVTNQAIRAFIDKHNANLDVDQPQISLKSIMLASYYLLLVKYLDQASVTVVSAFEGLESQSKTIQAASIHLPVSISIPAGTSLGAMVQIVEAEFQLALKNRLDSAFIYSHIFNKEFTQRFSSAAIFNIAFHYVQQQTGLSLDGSSCSKISIPKKPNQLTMPFELNFIVEEQANAPPILTFDYKQNIFKSFTIKVFLDCINAIVKSIVASPELAADQCSLVSEKQVQALAVHNKPIHALEIDLPIHEFFKRVSQSNPNRKAITFHGLNANKTSLTYAELNNSATQLAHFLVSQGFQGKTIGIATTRSIAQVICQMAVYYAGAISVPMDLKPDNKTTFKIENAAVKLILADAHTYLEYQNAYAANDTVEIFDVSPQTYLKEICTIALPSVSPSDIAYIRYTSGTTGNPKGVQVKHEGLTNLLNELKVRELPEYCKVLCTAPYTFDAFEFEALEAWVTSGELHLIHSDERLSPLTMQNIIQKEGINAATLLPEMIRNLDPSLLPSLKYVIVMGSRPDENIIKMWRQFNIRVCCEYGPTETTVCVTRDINQSNQHFSSIGYPIINTHIHILDEAGHECPFGFIGEIVISGKSVSLGYLNDPDATRQKFKAGAYHSGDYAFRDENGEIIFVGRKDNQFKLNGVRIELEGIQAYLRKHPDVESAAVLLNDNKMLQAFVIPVDKDLLNNRPEEIKNFISKINLYLSLPPGVGISKVIFVEKILLTQNGKIDKNALLRRTPTPVSPAINPLTGSQRKIKRIWQEVLRIEEFNITDTFEELNGGSLQLANLELAMIRVYGQSSQGMGELEINAAFLRKYNTVRKLAAEIDSRLNLVAWDLYGNQPRRVKALQDNIIPIWLKTLHQNSIKMSDTFEQLECSPSQLIELENEMKRFCEQKFNRLCGIKIDATFLKQFNTLEKFAQEIDRRLNSGVVDNIGSLQSRSQTGLNHHVDSFKHFDNHASMSATQHHHPASSSTSLTSGKHIINDKDASEEQARMRLNLSALR